MDTDPPTSPQHQVTIGRVMIVIAVLAVVFALAPNGLAAGVMSALGGFFYVLFRHVAPGERLPARVVRFPLDSWNNWRAQRAAKKAALKIGLGDF